MNYCNTKLKICIFIICLYNAIIFTIETLIIVFLIFCIGVFMNQLLNRKKAGIMAVIINICFLIVHILMLYIFSKNNVTPMVRFNIFSIIFYTVMLIIIRMGFLLFFNVATYLEVVLHMTLAIIYTGWDSGFQITLIGMNALAFFAEYIGRTVTGRYIPAAPLGILGMVAYLSSYIYTHIIILFHMFYPKVQFFHFRLFGQ